jgi:hypothetical protein
MQLLMQDEALRVSLESDDQVCVYEVLLIFVYITCKVGYVV